MAEMPQNGDYGGGYVKVQRHLRTAVISMGFALVTTTPFTANLSVPSIAQSQLTGYKYPAKQVRHTQPQDGWLYTGSLPFDPVVTDAPVEQSQLEGYRTPRRTVRQTEPQPVYNLAGLYSPALIDEPIRPTRKPWRDQPPIQDGWLYTAAAPTFDATVTVAPTEQSQLEGYRAPRRTVRQTEFQDGWVYPNLPVVEVWDASKFQNISGEMTPTRAALKFRYPLASTGFSTDGSTSDSWDTTKFQNNLSSRMPDRQKYDPRYEYHKFPFGLVDARVVIPAIDQLSNSERAVARKRASLITPESQGWIYTNLPVADVWTAAKFQNINGDRTPTRKSLSYRYDGYPSTDWIYPNLPAAFDPQSLVHSDDGRLRDRYKKVPLLDQPSQAWIYTAQPPFDAQFLIQVSAPTRMADRKHMDVRLQQFYNDLAWLRDVLSLPDPPAGRIYRRTAKGWQRIWFG